MGGSPRFRNSVWERGGVRQKARELKEPEKKRKENWKEMCGEEDFLFFLNGSRDLAQGLTHTR